MSEWFTVAVSGTLGLTGFIFFPPFAYEHDLFLQQEQQLETLLLNIKKYIFL